MKVGLMLPLHPWEFAAQTRDAAEKIGVDSLWTADHFLGLFHPEIWRRMPIAAVRPEPDPFTDPFCICAALGPTTRAPLGVGVTDAIRRAAPDLARTALTLQGMCAGGFNLGIGAGEAENLLPFGYPFEKPVAALETSLRLLRTLLDTGHMPTGPGRIGLPLETEVGKPRLWVAGHGPRTLRLTGKYADGWLPSRGMTTSAEEYGRRRAVVAECAAAAGRVAPEAGLGVFVMLGENRARVREMLDDEPLAKLMALVLRPEYFRQHGMEHPLGGQHRGIVDVIPHQYDPELLAAIAPTIPVELFEQQVVIGSAEEIGRELQTYAQQGCEHLMLINVTGSAGRAAEAQAQAPQLATLCHSL